jgi:predicted ATPase
MEDAQLQTALERLAEADILLVQGVPPDAEYRFKHALIQDAAYENLLKSRRHVLHRRISETLRDGLADTAPEPEILAHHFTQAGLIEAAIEWWGKAAQRSVERSALVEAIALFTRALDLIAILPTTPALRREQIKLQVGLIVPLMHVKGFAAPEAKAVVERAHLLIEQAEALREPPDDPLLLFSVLFAFCAANLLAFNGDALRELAAQFLTLAEKQGATVPLMVGHRIMGHYLFFTGNIAESRAHHNQSLALYKPAEHRPLATRFSVDTEVSGLSFRSEALWLLGYPEAAGADVDHALEKAREMRHTTTLMLALARVGWIYVHYLNHTETSAEAKELIALAEEKGSLYWKANGMMLQGSALALTGKAANAVKVLSSAITVYRATGATARMPLWSSYLARAYAELNQLDDAWRCFGEAMTAMEATKERWCEAEVNRIAGEIALKSPAPDTEKAEKYFDRALAVARQQQAKSWELRAAMSMARLWRDQGKRDEARDLLAPVYGWFTEGFDTLDLKEANALLDELVA